MRQDRFSTHLVSVLGAHLATLLMASQAAGSCDPPCTDISYSTSGSGGSLDVFDCCVDNGEHTILIEAEGSTTGFTITIEGIDDAHIFNVNVLNSGASNTYVIVNIIDGGVDDLAQVQSFEKNPLSTGEVWIGTIAPSGNIGPTVLHTGAKIEADKIGTLRTIAGDLTAEVIAHGSTIAQDNIAIETIEVDDLLHDITAENDQIGTITVSGDIGDPAFDDPMNPGKWVVIKGKRDVDSITASAIYADITTVWDDSSGTGILGLLETTAGDFVGDLKVYGFDPYNSDVMRIAGDLDADVTVTSQPLQSKIAIDDVFAEGRTIWFVQPYGLDDLGQISTGLAGASDTWDGTLKVGTSSPIIITADPDYSNAASTLGGGSMGESRYYLHESSCVPVDGGTMSVRSPDPTSLLVPPPCLDLPASIKLRFYGSVRKLPGEPSDQIVMVEKFNGTTWWDDVTTDFSANIIGDDRFITVTSDDDWPVGTYRMTPFLDDTEHINIQCADVVGPPFVRDFTYTVHAVDDCEEWLLSNFDLNNDNDLTFAGDVGAWVASAVDFTGDNVADGDDLEALLIAIDQFEE